MAQTFGEWNVSIRQACRVLEFDTSTCRNTFCRREECRHYFEAAGYDPD